MAFRRLSNRFRASRSFSWICTGPYPEYTDEDYEKQQTTNPNTCQELSRIRKLADLLKGIPRGSRLRLW